MIQDCYVNEGNQPWKKYVLDFDVEKFTKALLENKEFFEKNKGRGRIEINTSKAGKLYARFDTFVPVKQEENTKPVEVATHLAGREDDGIPF